MSLSVELSQTARDLLQSFRVPETEISEIVWFAIGASTVAFLFLFAMRFTRRQTERREPPLLPQPHERRREYHRVMINLPADVVVEGVAGILEGTLCDLSPGGVSVMVDHPIPKGTHLTLRFATNHESGNLSAEVIRQDRSHWSTHRHYLHCRFSGMTPFQEQSLAHLVAELEREKLKI